jgi:ribosomal protein S8E
MDTIASTSTYGVCTVQRSVVSGSTGASSDARVRSSSQTKGGTKAARKTEKGVGPQLRRDTESKSGGAVTGKQLKKASRKLHTITRNQARDGKNENYFSVLEDYVDEGFDHDLLSVQSFTEYTAPGTKLLMRVREPVLFDELDFIENQIRENEKLFIHFCLTFPGSPLVDTVGDHCLLEKRFLQDKRWPLRTKSLNLFFAMERERKVRARRNRIKNWTPHTREESLECMLNGILAPDKFTVLAVNNWCNYIEQQFASGRPNSAVIPPASAIYRVIGRTITNSRDSRKRTRKRLRKFALNQRFDAWCEHYQKLHAEEEAFHWLPLIFNEESAALATGVACGVLGYTATRMLTAQGNERDDTSVDWLPLEDTRPSPPSSVTMEPVEGEDRGAVLMRHVMAAIEKMDVSYQSIAFKVTDVVTSLYNLSLAQTKLQFMSLLYSGLRLLFRDVDMNVLVRFAHGTMNRFQTQAGGEVWRALSDTLGSMWSGLGSWVHCPMVDTAIDLMNVLVFAGFVNSTSLDVLDDPKYKLFSLEVKREVKSYPDMLGVVIKSAVMVTDMIASYFENGVLDFGGWSAGSNKELFETHASLMAEKVEATLGVLASGQRAASSRFRSSNQYDYALRKAINDCTTEVKKSKKPHDKVVYSRMLKDLLQIQNELSLTLRHSRARVKPFTFSVFGSTSSIKSQVATAIWTQVALANDIDIELTNHCTVNFKDQYFSEVTQQEILILDDFMNEKDTAASTVNPIRILLDWSSNNPVQMPAAAIDMKGVRYCMAKILGLTCHSKEFHAQTMSYQPEAAYRRVEVYVETELKPYFRGEDGQPDFTKIPKSKVDKLPDCWWFTCWRCVVGGTSWKWEIIGKPKMNNFELMKMMSEMSQRHFVIQNSIVERLNDKVWSCPHKCIPGCCYECEAIQKLDVPPDVLVPTNVSNLVTQAGTAELKYDVEIIEMVLEEIMDENHVEAVMLLMLPDLLAFKTLATLRSRVHYALEVVNDSGEPFISLGADFDVHEFVRCMREGPPPPPEIPEDVWNHFHQSDSLSDDEIETQAQSFERADRSYWVCVSKEEMDDLYPMCTRDEQGRLYQESITAQHANDPYIVTTEFTVYHYEFVFKVIMERITVNGGQDVTITGDKIKKASAEALRVAYGNPKTILGKARKDFVRKDIDIVVMKDEKLFRTINWWKFTYNFFALSKTFWAGSFLFFAFAPRLLITFTYFVNEIFHHPMNTWFPRAQKYMRKACKDVVDTTAPLQFGNRLSRYLDDAICPPETRRIMALKKAFDDGGLTGAARAEIFYRTMPPPTTLELYFGEQKGQRVKFALNVAGYVGAVAALYALYQAFREMLPVPEVTRTMRKPLAAGKELLDAKEKIPTSLNDVLRREVLEEQIEVLMERMDVADVTLKQILEKRDFYGDSEVQVNASTEGVIVPMVGEHKDSWTKVNPARGHLGEASQTTRPEDLEKKLERNLLLGQVRYTTPHGQPKVSSVHVLGIGGSDWLIPTHIFHDGVDDYTLEAYATEDQTAGPHVVGTFSRRGIVELEGVDFSVVRVFGSIPKSNLIDFFPLKEAAGVWAQLMYRKGDNLQKTAMKNMPKTRPMNVSHRGAHYKMMHVSFQQAYPIATYDGLCGAVWMSGVTSRPFIHSLHICGIIGKAEGGSCVITQSMLKEAVKELDEILVPSATSENYPLKTQGREWTPEIGERHFLNFIPASDEQRAILDVIGTHDGHSGKYKQDIRPSLIAEHLRARLDWPIVHKPVPHPNSTIHYYHAMKEIAYPRNTFVATILEKAVDDFRDKILDHVGSIPNLEEMVKPLVDTAVVSGLDAVVGIDKMNPNTSAGFPERGKKGRFYVPGDSDVPVSEPMTLDDYHLGLVAEMEDTMAKGERVYAPFTLSVKIEPVKVTKDHARLFGASNMCFTFVFRKYFLSIFRLIQLQPYHFETALGINCHSEDWNQMVEFLEHHDRLIEGDYQTYDKTMGASIILHSFGILIEIAKLAGYSPRQIRIMQTIATEVAFPVYEARGVLFVAGGSNPSGHPGTFIINCFANSLFMRYAFYWSIRRHGIPFSAISRPFDDFVNLVTAGDDHLAGVSPDCTWFDQHVVQAALASVRVGYTDGKKNPHFEAPFIDLRHASFVSRGFRHCSYLQRWVAPLAIKSLQKSYMIHNFGDNCPYGPEELLAIVVEQNEVELFLHGKEKFEVLNNAVRGAMDDAGLERWKPVEKTWEEVGDILKERTTPAFHPDLTTQALVEDDEPPKKKICQEKFVLNFAFRAGNPVRRKLRNSTREITDPTNQEIREARISGVTLSMDACSMSHGQVILLRRLATNHNNSTNGMTGSANVVHDNPGALSWTSSRRSSFDASRELYSGETDGLSSYLERPVLVDTLDWSISVTLYQEYKPLTKIMNSLVLKNKLQNFANITFDLEIDVEVSSNPFLYGMLLLSWIPFTKYDNLTYDRQLIPEDNVEASQRQRIFVDASTSSGGKMTIPFYWPTNYFSLVKDNPDDFGTLSCRQLNPLMHVSGANQVVTVYIRARMVNVKMHTSTIQTFGAQPVMSVQADESPDDKLSSKATAFAGVAKSLTPVLGGYATATAAAASGAADILRAMGLSHPRSKEMTHKFENRPLGNMSNFNTPSSALTLGLDEHNEVTVDPKVSNLVEDEMALSYILKKEAYIGSYDWSVTSAEGTILATHRVHPFQYLKNSLGEYHCSPLAYVSRLFQFWTGTIRFRFQVVCSKWHRGRLRIIHEPIYTSTIPDTAWQTNLQSVVDITEERDFTIDVKYVQGQMWCQTGSIKQSPPSFYTQGSGTDYTPSALIDANGLLKVVVMNRLVIPDDTVVAPAHINVFVSAGDDFEVNVPYDSLADSTVVGPATGGSQTINAGQPEVAILAFSSNAVTTFDSNGIAVPKITMNTTPTFTNGVPWVTTAANQVALGSISLTNPSATSSNVTVTFGGATQTKPIPAGGTTAFTIANAPVAGLINYALPMTTSHDAASPITYQIATATLPVKPGYKYKSAIDPSYTFLARDGQQDVVSYTSPPPAYPVQGILAGAPMIVWKVGGSTGLYSYSNNGNNVYMLTKGPARVVSGIYGPTYSNTNDSTPFVHSINVDSTAPLYVRNNFQIMADFTLSTTVPVVIYDAVFTVPALTTQADEQDDTIADPQTPPTQATFHDVSVPDVNALIYFGERITHLRQILGRPQYYTSYSLVGGTTLTRNAIIETDIPEYPTIDGVVANVTPFMFMMGCYNGWRGSIRTKYVFNNANANLPVMARLERRQVGLSGRSQTSVAIDTSTVAGMTTLINTTTSMWSGAIITNPHLANELNAEFPYYYRYRFRSARPRKFNGASSSTNSHILTVDFVNAPVNGAYVDRYFQPGEDFTLLNWVSTPVLF